MEAYIDGRLCGWKVGRVEDDRVQVTSPRLDDCLVASEFDAGRWGRRRPNKATVRQSGDRHHTMGGLAVQLRPHVGEMDNTTFRLMLVHNVPSRIERYVTKYVYLPR